MSILQLRPTVSVDRSALGSLYEVAFPDEDLREFVHSLVGDPDCALSLMAEHEGQLAGHIVFTRCTLPGYAGWIALLGPLAVRPDLQKQGFGSTLVRDGLKQMQDAGSICALVLGDPAYYGRFGFESGHGIFAPYPLPKEYIAAWCVMYLKEGLDDLSGTLKVPEPWQVPELWM